MELLLTDISICFQQRINRRRVVRHRVQRAAVVPRPPRRPARHGHRQPPHHHAHRPQIRRQHHPDPPQTRPGKRPRRTPRHYSPHRLTTCHSNSFRLPSFKRHTHTTAFRNWYTSTLITPQPSSKIYNVLEHQSKFKSRFVLVVCITRLRVLWLWYCKWSEQTVLKICKRKVI